MITLEQTSPNKYQFKGEMTYLKRVIKEVYHEGERYTNEKLEECTESLCDMRKSNYRAVHFFDYEYEIPTLKLCVSIEDYSGFPTSLSNKASRQYWSQNDYANCISLAYNLGLLDKRIKGVSTGKGYDRPKWTNILKTSLVWVRGEHYGAGQFVWYAVHVRSLFQCESKEIDRDILEVFSLNGVNLSSRNKEKEALSFLNKKINYKHDTSKQQINARVHIRANG